VHVAEQGLRDRGCRGSGGLDTDTAKDMADIDSRLLALQEFLMAAKSSQ